MDKGGVKEFDFDELDRAVNSVIANVPVQTASADKEKVVTLSPSAAPSESAFPAATPIVPARPATPRRSSGRFMDVVHSSSDMHPVTPVPPRISRQGTSLTPSTDPVATPTPTPVADTPVVATPPTEAPKSTQEWPDPLDFSGFTPSSSVETPTELPAEEPTVDRGFSVPVTVGVKSTELTPEIKEDADINQIADDITQTLGGASGDEPELPQTSPFLSDTKVDKRPLGAFSTEQPSVAPTIMPSADLVMPDAPTAAPEPAPLSSFVPTSAENDDPQTALESTPLPAELQSDLLSIESGGDDIEAQTASNDFPQSSPEPVGPTSINQQYQEQPSTGDQKTGNIFDTSNYHQALAHPAKKKSGWMWVIWIFALLVVGAGAGAAIYFYVLPLLH